MQRIYLGFYVKMTLVHLVICLIHPAMDVAIPCQGSATVFEWPSLRLDRATLSNRERASRKSRPDGPGATPVHAILALSSALLRASHARSATLLCAGCWLDRWLPHGALAR